MNHTPVVAGWIFAYQGLEKRRLEAVSDKTDLEQKINQASQHCTDQVTQSKIRCHLPAPVRTRPAVLLFPNPDETWRRRLFGAG